MANVYMVGSHIVGAGGGIYVTGGGGTFTPTGSQTMTGTIADGQNVLLNGTFAAKPNGATPHFWCPAETQFNPSTLGRVQSWNPNFNSLTFSSSGGPTGLGCITGSGSPGTGGTGTQSSWAIGFDIDNWTGWSSAPYALNTYGQKTRVSRSILRHLLPYLPGSGSSGWNTKNYRAWARTGGIGSGIQGGGPDFYAPPCNGRFEVEDITIDWSPSPDYNADPIAIALYENLQDTWFKEEVKYICNSNSSTADANYNWQAYASGFPLSISNITKASSCVVTSSSSQSSNPFEQLGNNEQQLIFDGVQGMTQINGQIGRVTAAGGSAGAWTATVGINTTGFSSYISGGFAAYMVWNFPNTSYQTNSWKLLNASNSGLTNAVGGGGNILQSYPIHYIVDGTSGRNNAPAGSYPEYAHVFQEDSWVWAVLQDSPYYNAGATIREPQIPYLWPQTGTPTQIGFLLRQGLLPRGQPAYLFTTDNNDAATLQGYVTWP
jgi:hypothetical protein